MWSREEGIVQERGLVCSKGLGGLKGSVWSKGGPSQASCEWAADSRMRREHAGSREWAGLLPAVALEKAGFWVDLRGSHQTAEMCQRLG